MGTTESGKQTRTRANLTQKAVAAIKVPAKRTWVYDDAIPGFFLDTRPNGKKVFYFQYGSGPRRRIVRVGTWGAITADQARTEAKRLRAEFELGGDPAAERDRQRQIPTWGEWCKTYLERFTALRKDPRSLRMHLETSKHYIPASTPVDQITRADVERARHALAKRDSKKNPGKVSGATVNRFTAYIRSALSGALKEGYITTHPALRLDPFPEGAPRKRVLSEDEIARLVAAVELEKDPVVRCAFHLLLGTGARLSEVLHAKWSDFDLEAEVARWTIPSPKSGTPQTIPVPREVVEILKKTPRRDVYVVASSRKGVPRRQLRSQWDRVMQDAKLVGALDEAGEPIRMYSIRKTVITRAALTSGISVAQQIGRHSSPAITARHYVNVGMERMRDAMEGALLPFPVKKTAKGKK